VIDQSLRLPKEDIENLLLLFWFIDYDEIPWLGIRASWRPSSDLGDFDQRVASDTFALFESSYAASAACKTSKLLNRSVTHFCAVPHLSVPHVPRRHGKTVDIMLKANEPKARAAAIRF
jgi:hypothetical protein